MSARTPTSHPARPATPAGARRPPARTDVARTQDATPEPGEGGRWSPRPGTGTVLDGQGPRPTLLGSLPEGSVRAVLAGVEAAVFGWLCAVVPAVASYVATAAAPALGEATWLQAAVVGSGVWRLAHGGAVALSGATVSIVPLGLTLLAALLVAISVRRSGVRSFAALVASVVGYSAVAVVLASLPPTALGGPGRVAIGALAVGSSGALLGIRSAGAPWPIPAGEPGRRLEALVAGLPVEVRSVATSSLRASRLALLVLAAAGLLIVVVMTAVNHAAFSGALGALGGGPVGVVGILLAVAALLPTVVVWVVSWLAGPGFFIGEGALVTAGAGTSGPLPMLPLLAGLPGQSPAGRWTSVVVVLVGVLLGWQLHRRSTQARQRAAASAAVLSAAVCGLVVWVLAAAAGGSVGPGRMALVGPDAGAAGLAVAGLLVAGALPTVLGMRADTRQGVRRLVGRAVTRARR